MQDNATYFAGFLVKCLLQVKKTCLLTPWAMVLNFSPADIHPVADTDPDPASILSWSDLYLIAQYYALAMRIISWTILNVSGTAGHEVGFQDCPGNSGTVGKCVT